MLTIFMGTGDIGLPALRWLIASRECELIAVYTQPDRPVGRHLDLTPPQVKVLALEHGLPVFQPEKLRDPAAFEVLRSLEPDLIVVMAYGQILSRKVLDLPRIACVNLHASLLPRHRGASPIQGAIRDGDPVSGITVMHVAPELDAGDIILMESCPVEPGETGGTLHDKLAGLAPIALEKAVPMLMEGKAPRVPQDAGLATYDGKLNREDGAIDWSRDAVELERLIRAYDPWPGTYTELEGRKLKLLPLTEVRAEVQAPPGTVVKAEGDELIVACGRGGLALREVQLEGRKRMPVRAFLVGQATPPRRFGPSGED